MKSRLTGLIVLVGLASLLRSADVASQPSTARTPAIQFRYAQQDWTPADRRAFYTTSQGSQIMPYDWFRALQRHDADELFAADGLRRYGYLPNEYATNNLPVGFVVDTRPASHQIGMTCAACHTGQLEFTKDGVTHSLRLDGAPAHADFQLFLADLTLSARATATDQQRFDVFSRAVLGAGFTPGRAAELKTSFDAWVAQFGEFMDRSLPPSSWGPGRLDAFNMIFNRVTARDIGQPGNFAVADAPVSYPFLWNASRQDRTQWNGGVDNGLFIHALGRNTGEVLGVFAKFAPRQITPGIIAPPVIQYGGHTADFDGLQLLEEKIVALKPPPWPRDIFGLNEELAAEGKRHFEKHCTACHGEKESDLVPGAWATPVQVVGTDAKMARNAAGRMVGAGLLTGALLPKPPGARLQANSKAADVLANSVVGILLDGVLRGETALHRAAALDFQKLQLGDPDIIKLAGYVKENLNGLFRKPAASGEGAYEARVMHGIWATAPYLHNGSVPNLWELLKPPKERKTAFKVGSRAFDPVNVGFVTDQSPFAAGDFSVDPENSNGNGNGGHIYGTNLTEADRWALIEYLKTL